MKKLLSLVGMSILFSACNDGYEYTDDSLDVRLFVEVVGNSMSRTVTDADGNVSFSGNDKIGLFMESQENPLLWTYQNNSWISEKNVKWENRTDDFKFFAYYPCEETEGVTLSSVPMPDLSVQSGNIADAGSKDFLVGSCISSYSDNNGVVSFSGDNSFTHVYSFLYIKVINDDQNESFSMSRCTLSGEGIVTPHEYSFDASSQGMKKTVADDVSALNIDDLSSLSEIAVLINPVTLDSPLKFTLGYNIDGKAYEASTGIGTDFKGGSFYKITLRVVDGKLTLTGCEVNNWNVITLDEIVIMGA